MAALHLGESAESDTNRLPEVFAAVDHAEQAILKAKPSFDQTAKQLLDRTGVPGGGLRKAEHLLAARFGRAYAPGLLLACHVLAIDPHSQEMVLI